MKAERFPYIPVADFHTGTPDYQLKTEAYQ